MVFGECVIGEIRHLIQQYLDELSAPFDSFLEEHILSSVFYRIRDDSNDVGYLAIHGNEKLTQFYIRRPYRMHSQKLFKLALEGHGIKRLFVPTCDEPLMSLALDHEVVIARQAYFFQDSLTAPADRGLGNGETFRAAAPDDLQAIRQVCGAFLDEYERRISDGQLFVYYGGDELLGVGVIELSKLFERTASIGMFVNAAFRKQGVGTALIVRLRIWCRDHGITPIAGCWYYNEASKRTLESAGMVTKTRLLNIEIPDTRISAVPFPEAGQ